MADPSSIQPKFVEGYPSTPINPATQSTVYISQPPYYQTGGQVQNAQFPNNMQPPAGGIYTYPLNQNPAIVGIRDWLPWSITNIFVGWLLAGILPLIFSLFCRSYKRSNNAQSAKTMSMLALIFNILITLAGIAGWIGLIVSLVLAARVTNAAVNCGLAAYC